MEKDYFSTRATVRRYDAARQIAPELLESILTRAMKAPTCGTMQLYSVVVTRDEAMKEALVPLHFSQPAAAGADVILTVCADFNRFTRWCEVSGANPGYDNLLSFTSAFADAVIFAQQIVTIAEMEGLGTCYLGTVTYNADRISELLELPELVVPVASLSLGWPVEKGEPTDRLPLRAVMHEERYRSYSDEEIKALYAEKEQRDDNRRFVEENGKRNLAEVFTDIRYPRGLNESVSKMLLRHLAAKKFI